jgi:hypothetical protein
VQKNYIEATPMLETKERDALQSSPLPERDGKAAAIVPAGDQGHPEMVVVIGLVAVISMVFGFLIGLLF